MSQSSETWHDNVPAEVIVKESGILAKAAENIAIFWQNITIHSSRICLSEATLGSYCKIQYTDDEIMWIYIVGTNLAYSNYDTGIANIPDDTSITSIHGPLAQAIIGKHTDAVLYVNNNVRVRLLTIKNNS